MAYQVFLIAQACQNTLNLHPTGSAAMPSNPKIACFSRPALAAVWLAALLLAGCRTINPYDPRLEPPCPRPSSRRGK